MNCGAPAVTATQAANGPVRADTPSGDGTRLFQSGAAFTIALTSSAPAPDTVVWSVQDQLGNARASGSFKIPGGVQTNTLTCTSSLAGYFAISATLAKAGGQLPQAGTRPAGIATFGVLPNLTSVLGTPAYAHQDQHRFGMQGFNGNGALLADLGVTQTLDGRALSNMEPNGPNTWTPSLSDVDPFYTNGQVMRLVRLDGIPAWASPTGTAQDDTYAPSNLTYYQNFMARVGTDTANIRAAYFPQQQNDYYQVTWEPQWVDTPANFVAMYAAAYNGLHATDPKAVVMGTTNGFAAGNPQSTAYWLHQYAALGLPNYIDAVATHAYYDAGTSPSHPPERLATDPAGAPNALMNEMRTLRSEMQIDYRPNMRLVSTEAGISYDVGTSYGPSYPTGNVLFAQAAVAARMHIIILGEGAQTTYFFYGPDYPGEPGYGTFFDDADAQGAFGATDISPKPEALALAAMTRILDGTTTLGYLNGMPPMTYGYAFQRLGGGPVVTALWTHNNAVWSASAGFSSTYGTAYNLAVDAPGTSGTVRILDMMGNVSTAAYTDGVVPLTLTEAPIYVVSNNAGAMQAHVTAPVGYTGQ